MIFPRRKEKSGMGFLDKLFGRKKREQEKQAQEELRKIEAEKAEEEAKAKAEAEAKAKAEAEAKAKAEAEAKAKAEAEAKAKAEAEAKAKAEAEAKAKAEAEAKAKAEAEAKAKAEAEAKAKAEAEAKAKAEAEAKAKAEAEAKAKAKAEAEAKAKAEAEAKAKAEAEAKAKAEAEAKAKAEAEAKAKAEAEAKAKAEAEAKAKAEAEAKAKAEAEAKAKAEAEAKAKAEAEAKAKAEAEAEAEAEAKAKAEAEAKAKAEAEAKAAEEPEVMTEETRKKEKKSFWSRVREGLTKTKNALFGQIDDLLKNFVKVDEDLLEELEEVLICADVGVNAAEDIIDELREQIKDGRLKEKEQVTATLHRILEGMIGEGEDLKLETSPSVILVIGVNGVGKTTSIGKIANRLRKEGKKVIVAAADTFRAAAIDQLAVWCERAKVELVRQNEGSDPAAVVFDACHVAKNKKADVLIIDTAGRLHNKTNLMNELAKINRVIDRELPGVSRENLLVLDATTGQNAILQAKEFKNAAALTGLILNKLDGTAKGGIVISIRRELNIPVKFIGVGEKLDDMQEFDQAEFVKALFE
ncbi:MAG: signal recognition particle-docking protein FtsY [Ruminococcaceae bacterium]|nr:signal recognition particle-docking protein FtsY [Oscillospiraceae bacterium]